MADPVKPETWQEAARAEGEEPGPHDQPRDVIHALGYDKATALTRAEQAEADLAQLLEKVDDCRRNKGRGPSYARLYELANDIRRSRDG